MNDNVIGAFCLHISSPMKNFISPLHIVQLFGIHPHLGLFGHFTLKIWMTMLYVLPVFSFLLLWKNFIFRLPLSNFQQFLTSWHSSSPWEIVIPFKDHMYFFKYLNDRMIYAPWRLKVTPSILKWTSFKVFANVLRNTMNRRKILVILLNYPYFLLVSFLLS